MAEKLTPPPLRPSELLAIVSPPRRPTEDTRDSSTTPAVDKPSTYVTLSSPLDYSVYFPSPSETKPTVTIATPPVLPTSTPLTGRLVSGLKGKPEWQVTDNGVKCPREQFLVIKEGVEITDFMTAASFGLLDVRTQEAPLNNKMILQTHNTKLSLAEWKKPVTQSVSKNNVFIQNSVNTVNVKSGCKQNAAATESSLGSTMAFREGSNNPKTAGNTTGGRMRPRIRKRGRRKSSQVRDKNSQNAAVSCSDNTKTMSRSSRDEKASGSTIINIGASASRDLGDSTRQTKLAKEDSCAKQEDRTEAMSTNADESVGEDMYTWC